MLPLITFKFTNFPVAQEDIDEYNLCWRLNEGSGAVNIGKFNVRKFILSWDNSEWDACLPSCAVSNRTRVRTVKCVGNDGVVYVDDRCLSIGMEHPGIVESCESYPCPHNMPTAWSMCSKKCDGGLQSRYLTCRDFHGNPSDSDECSSAEHVFENLTRSQACNTHPCIAHDKEVLVVRSFVTLKTDSPDDIISESELRQQLATHFEVDGRLITILSPDETVPNRPEGFYARIQFEMIDLEEKFIQSTSTHFQEMGDNSPFWSMEYPPVTQRVRRACDSDDVSCLQKGTVLDIGSCDAYPCGGTVGASHTVCIGSNGEFRDDCSEISSLDFNFGLPQEGDSCHVCPVDFTIADEQISFENEMQLYWNAPVLRGGLLIDLDTERFGNFINATDVGNAESVKVEFAAYLEETFPSIIFAEDLPASIDVVEPYTKFVDSTDLFVHSGIYFNYEVVANTGRNAGTQLREQIIGSVPNTTLLSGDYLGNIPGATLIYHSPPALEWRLFECVTAATDSAQNSIEVCQVEYFAEETDFGACSEPCGGGAQSRPGPACRGSDGILYDVKFCAAAFTGQTDFSALLAGQTYVTEKSCNTFLCVDDAEVVEVVRSAIVFPGLDINTAVASANADSRATAAEIEEALFGGLETSIANVLNVPKDYVKVLGVTTVGGETTNSIVGRRLQTRGSRVDFEIIIPQEQANVVQGGQDVTSFETDPDVLLARVEELSDGDEDIVSSFTERLEENMEEIVPAISWMDVTVVVDQPVKETRQEGNPIYADDDTILGVDKMLLIAISGASVAVLLCISFGYLRHRRKATAAVVPFKTFEDCDAEVSEKLEAGKSEDRSLAVKEDAFAVPEPPEPLEPPITDKECEAKRRNSRPEPSPPDKWVFGSGKNSDAAPPPPKSVADTCNPVDAEALPLPKAAKCRPSPAEDPEIAKNASDTMPGAVPDNQR